MLDSLASQHPAFFAWVFLPVLIFLARTTDMGLSTLRILFIAQGRKFLAAMMGFFEALVWLFVIGQILNHLSNPLCVMAYAGGYAAGNALGLYIEERLAMGLQILRIVTQSDPAALIEELKEAGHGVTAVDGSGAMGPVKLLFTVVRRREVGRVTEMISRLAPRAFFSVGDVRRAAEGVFLPPQRLLPSVRWRSWRTLRKSK